MPSQLKNRAVALGITAVVIAVSILLGGRSSLLNLRQNSLDVYQGVYQNGGSKEFYGGIADDLRAIIEDTANLLTVAERGAPPDHILFSAAASSRDALVFATATAGPREQHEAAERLRAALYGLESLLKTADLSDEDLTLCNKLMINIESRFSTIEGDPYNSLAAEFNRELTVFPASLLADLTGVEPLELYQ